MGVMYGFFFFFFFFCCNYDGERVLIQKNCDFDSAAIMIKLVKLIRKFLSGIHLFFLVDSALIA